MRRFGFITIALLAALSLPAGALGRDTIDQAQEIVGCGVGGDGLIAQVFTAGQDGTVAAVGLHRSSGIAWSKVGVTVEIRDAVSGHPGETILASTLVKSGSKGWIKIPFRTGAAVTQGAQYAIVLHSVQPASYDCAQHDPYAGGDLMAKTDLDWFGLYDEGTTVSWDLSFRTYLG